MNEPVTRLQTVHKLSGVGLLPWGGKVRRDFEARYRQWLTQEGTRFSSLTYVGSVVSWLSICCEWRRIECVHSAKLRLCQQLQHGAACVRYEAGVSVANPGGKPCDVNCYRATRQAAPRRSAACSRPVLRTRCADSPPKNHPS